MFFLCETLIKVSAYSQVGDQFWPDERQFKASRKDNHREQGRARLQVHDFEVHT